MVLTNFECWAHGGGAGGVDGSAAGMELPFGTAAPTRHVDLFSPRAVQQTFGIAEAVPPAGVAQHVSTNCYYGFSYVNAAHENNNNNTNAQNQNSSHNNNNNNGCMPNANDVNGIAMMHDAHAEGDGAAYAAAAAVATGGVGGNVARCKKRYFVTDDDYANCDIGAGVGIGAMHADVAAKRCRFDDDYAAAQYCNDFFSLPSTQIGTQSCLMDTEDYSQSQQQTQQQQPHSQQVDVAMGAAIAQPNFNQQSAATTASNIHFASQLQQAQQQQQLQHEPQPAHAQTVATAAAAIGSDIAQQLPPAAYQQQHNYQGHLHRANRDVSRCLVSHLI